VATEVLRSTPSQRPSRLLKATVRPVAYCGPRCRVRRDSTVFPVFNDGLAAQCGPLASSLAPPSSSVFTTSRRSSRLRYGLFTTSRLRFLIPNVATLQRLEGVAVDVLTSRTWFCRSSLRAV
jgi:hypothetical protein